MEAAVCARRGKAMGTQELAAGRGHCLLGWQPAFQLLKLIIKSQFS